MLRKADGTLIEKQLGQHTMAESLPVTMASDQSDNIYRNWLIEVERGNISGASIVHKFGAATVTTSLAPMCESNVYMTPTTAQALEFVSSDNNDGAGTGAGALQVTITGLNSAWAEVTQTVTCNGTTPVALGTDLIRLYRWYVSSSGTYATVSAGSHAGTLTIRAAGAGATWSIIPVSPFPIGQSLIGAYTVPAGKTAYLMTWDVHSDASKSLSALFFQRENANDVTTPFSGTMRTVSYQVGIVGDVSDSQKSPRGPFVGPCDLGVLASVTTSTGRASTDFELLLIDS